MNKLYEVVIILLITQVIFFQFSCKREMASNEGERGNIVALTPSLASAVLSVSPDAPLVAASQYSVWPEQVKSVAVLPTPAPLEQVVSYRPGLVLAHPSDGVLIAKLEQLGIRVLAHSMDTLSEIESAWLSIGEALGQRDKGEKAIKRLWTEIRDAIPADVRPKAVPLLFIVDFLDARMQQIYVAQNDAFLASLAENCGADVLRVGKSNWARLSAEELIRLDPYAIVVLSYDEKQRAERQKQFEANYPSLSAIKAGHVIYYNDAALSQPDDRLGRTQKVLCEGILKLYPAEP